MFLKSSTTSSTLLFVFSGLIFISATLILLFSFSLLIEWEFLILHNTPIWLYLFLDPQGILLSSVVLFISANVIQFATFYIRDEPFLNRFIILVLLFVLSINLLIFIPHFIILLLGWDGLGVTSFILVIYYQSPNALGAGIITALTNRIGDVFILIAIGLCLHQRHWNILLMWNSNYNFFIIILITLAAITKRAQIPFSRWLPAAIAAPTPVSALVHSSTLVTAGVFLLIRFYPFLSAFKFFNTFLLIVACLTIIIAGLVALRECDLKKIIALSTLRQLGVIIAAIALGLPNLALFHLIAHALFKALLFICAGAIIHINNHSQDLRQVGNLYNQIPCIISCMVASNLALCGLPFIAGFYSKDLILEIRIYNFVNIFIFVLFILGTLITASYSIRFLSLGWFSPKFFSPQHSIKDSALRSISPALILTLGAIIGGRALNWIIISPFIEPYITTDTKLIPFVITILGALIIFSVYQEKISIFINQKLILNFLCSMWFLTPLSTQLSIVTPLKSRLYIFKNLDQGWNEFLGPQGIFKFSIENSQVIINPQKIIPTVQLFIISFVIIPLIFLFCFNSLNKA